MKLKWLFSLCLSGLASLPPCDSFNARSPLRSTVIIPRKSQSLSDLKGSLDSIARQAESLTKQVSMKGYWPRGAAFLLATSQSSPAWWTDAAVKLTKRFVFSDIFSTQLYWRILKTALTKKLSVKDSTIAYIAGFNSLSALLSSVNSEPGGLLNEGNVERSLQETAAAMRRMVLSIILLFFVGEPANATAAEASVFRRAVVAVLDFLPYIAYAVTLSELSVSELVTQFGALLSKLKSLLG